MARPGSLPSDVPGGHVGRIGIRATIPVAGASSVRYD
jgi:hypothetical protein